MNHYPHHFILNQAREQVRNLRATMQQAFDPDDPTSCDGDGESYPRSIVESLTDVLADLDHWTERLSSVPVSLPRI